MGTGNWGPRADPMKGNISLRFGFPEENRDNGEEKNGTISFLGI